MSSAPDAETERQRFRVTHLFHPLFGYEFDLISYAHCWAEDRVFYLDDTQHARFAPS